MDTPNTARVNRTEPEPATPAPPIRPLRLPKPAPWDDVRAALDDWLKAYAPKKTDQGRTTKHGVLTGFRVESTAPATLVHVHQHRKKKNGGWRQLNTPTSAVNAATSALRAAGFEVFQLSTCRPATLLLVVGVKTD